MNSQKINLKIATYRFKCIEFGDAAGVRIIIRLHESFQEMKHFFEFYKHIIYILYNSIRNVYTQ